MVDLDRHRVTWTGFVGAPGLSTFYCSTGSSMNPSLNAFLTSMCGYLPGDVNLQIEPTGDTIDSATGTIVGAWADTAEAMLTGTYTGSYSAVSGALVRWNTSTFLGGRRLRGHTYFVPIGDGSYDSAGRIAAANVTGASAAAQALVTAMGAAFMVWQRPRLAAPAYTDRHGRIHPAITARIGGYGPVTTGTCRAAVTELRSRRD